MRRRGDHLHGGRGTCPQMTQRFALLCWGLVAGAGAEAFNCTHSL